MIFFGEVPRGYHTLPQLTTQTRENKKHKPKSACEQKKCVRFWEMGTQDQARHPVRALRL